MGLLLLGKGAVLAHRFERPLAAELDEDRQRGPTSPPPVSRIQTPSELWTGTIGARRAWTVSMISVLSMPWR